MNRRETQRVDMFLVLRLGQCWDEYMPVGNKQRVTAGYGDDLDHGQQYLFLRGSRRSEKCSSRDVSHACARLLLDRFMSAESVVVVVVLLDQVHRVYIWVMP